MKSPVTTHVLDTAAGKPAAGVPVKLEHESDDGWREVGSSTTDADGRISNLLTSDDFKPGVYRITFELDTYFRDQGRHSFYREVPVIFVVADAGEHYHIPLLLSPFGYSTYRGS